MVKLPEGVTWSLPGALRTFAIGEVLGRSLSPGTLLILTGPTGIGKTDFCKGVARSVGVREVLTSPTFLTWQAYDDGRVPLFHGDLDRFSGGSSEEFDWALTDDCLGKIALVEWGERLSFRGVRLFPTVFRVSLSWFGEGEDPDRTMSLDDCSWRLSSHWGDIVLEINLLLNDWKRWKD